MDLAVGLSLVSGLAGVVCLFVGQVKRSNGMKNGENRALQLGMALLVITLAIRFFV